MELIDIINSHLGDCYACTRVWEAWNVGTMDQDDFKDIKETCIPEEMAAEIQEKVIAPILAKQAELVEALRRVKAGLCYPNEYFQVADEVLNKL